MNTESRKTIHYGFNFIVAPMAGISKNDTMDFEKKLSEAKIDFEKRETPINALKLLRTSDSPLLIQLSVTGPQVGQLLVVSSPPRGPLELFLKEAEIICGLFKSIWNVKQVVHRDATIRCLYSVPESHAFKYLWEKRLGQTELGLAALKRQVLGGGLRFVMPPSQGEQNQVEVKIESFLRDSRMLFVETSFVWTSPGGVDDAMKPRDLLMKVDDFINSNVVNLIIQNGGSSV